MNKKVLITSRSFGKTSNEVFSILENAGISYTKMGADYSDEKFSQIVADYDAIIIGAHKFEPSDMERCKKLKIIAKHGAGIDNIDINKAKELGITVTNVPAMNANAVADLTFAHILNSSRGVSLTNEWVRKGQWKTYIGKDVYNKTLGLIGFGNIAKNVARRGVGFSMKVLAYDPYVDEVPKEFEDYVTLCDFDKVVTESNIISIHIPLSDESKDMFNTKTILSMREDAVLVNTGRGGIINEMDLYNCMKNGHLLAAALDVCTHEPIESDNPLLTMDNVVITPHIGMYSIEAVNAVGLTCAKNVVKKLEGQEPDFVVTS
jgi:D-3-phosphoglycerate dehydrogenase